MPYASEPKDASKTRRVTIPQAVVISWLHKAVAIFRFALSSLASTILLILLSRALERLTIASPFGSEA